MYKVTIIEVDIQTDELALILQMLTHFASVEVEDAGAIQTWEVTPNPEMQSRVLLTLHNLAKRQGFEFKILENT